MEKQKEQKTKKANLKARLVLLYILSFITSILPLTLCLIVKREAYFTTVGESVKLALGGTILLVLVVIKVLGKVKLPGRVVLFATVFVMSYLMEAILRDLTLLSGMALLGEVIDALLFAPSIKRTRERITIDKTSDATTEKVEEVIKKYLGGRV